MNFARGLDPNKIQKLVLGPPYSNSGFAPDGPDKGADVVFPNCTKIVPALANMLQLGDKAMCNIQGNNGKVNSNIASTGKQPLSPDRLTIHNSATRFGESSATLNLSSGPGDLFGMRDLLDLMFLGVFEAPGALQV